MSEANERNKIEEKEKKKGNITLLDYSDLSVANVSLGSSIGIVRPVSSVLSTSSVTATVVEGGGAVVCVSSCSS